MPATKQVQRFHFDGWGRCAAAKTMQSAEADSRHKVCQPSCAAARCCDVPQAIGSAMQS